MDMWFLVRPLTWKERIVAFLTGRFPRYTHLRDVLAEGRVATLSVRSLSRLHDAERIHYTSLCEGEQKLALFLRGYYGAEIEQGLHSGMGSAFDAAVFYMGRERQYAQLFKRFPSAIQAGPGSKEWEQMLASMADIIMQGGR